jgi:hypothetical protein
LEIEERPEIFPQNGWCGYPGDILLFALHYLKNKQVLTPYRIGGIYFLAIGSRGINLFQKGCWKTRIRRHSRGGGNPECLEKTGFPLSRE